MNGELKIFLSQVTGEFKAYRAELFKALQGPRVAVKQQDDFINLGGNTLAMLNDYIAQCNCVIHLVGKGTGSSPTPHEVSQLQLSNLADTVPFLPDAIAKGESLSYTQWEAYLALAHRKKLHYFVADEKAVRPADFQTTSEGIASQQLHHQRLEAIGRFGKTFADGNDLFKHVAQELINNLLGSEFPAIQERFPDLMPIPNNLPAVGSLFKGRDEFLDKLRQVLTSKSSHVAAVTAKHAIHGLGGVGKTRVAIEYGRKYADDYSALLFITADSPSNLDSHLARLCGALVLNLPEQNAREQEVQVNAALHWLKSHTGWFLIVDNVDTEEAAQAVEAKLAHLRQGHIVITSRLAKWKNLAEALELDVLSEPDAQAFLLERTAGSRAVRTSDGADALQLAKDLGALPLALEHAGAYISEDGCSLGDYRELWQSKDRDVVHWHDELVMKYPRSLATTWQTSFEKLSPDAQGLMQVVCWLAPEPIPLDMLEKLRSDEGQVVIDVDKARRDLLKYSFFKWTGPEHASVVIHRLVQEVTAFRLAVAEQTAWVKRALQIVDDFVVGNVNDVRTWKSVYTPARHHIAAVVKHADQRNVAEPTARLMNQLAAYLDSRAEYAEAEPLMRRALAIDEMAYGPEHPSVAIRLNNLAQLLDATNRLAEAEPLMRRALTIDEKAYGPEHPNVARDLNNLANLLRVTNRLVEAESLMRRALAIDEKSYGPEHLEVATDLNCLAVILQNTNRLVEAESLMRRALAISEQSYGPDHPSVAIRLNNLALLLDATNRLTEAEPLMRRSLAISEQSYGPDHPSIAIRLNNLARLLEATDRPEEAEPLSRRMLFIFHHFQFLTGHQHPHFEVGRNNYTSLLRKLGSTDEQIEQALREVEAEARASSERGA